MCLGYQRRPSSCNFGHDILKAGYRLTIHHAVINVKIEGTKTRRLKIGVCELNGDHVPLVIPNDCNSGR